MLVIASFAQKYTSLSYPITRHKCPPQIKFHTPYSNLCALIGNKDHVPKSKPRELNWPEYMEIQRQTLELLIIFSPSKITYESYYIKYHTRISLSLELYSFLG